jgi:hypothetical protein
VGGGVLGFDRLSLRFGRPFDKLRAALRAVLGFGKLSLIIAWAKEFLGEVWGRIGGGFGGWGDGLDQAQQQGRVHEGGEQLARACLVLSHALNSIGSRIVPATNNPTEQVIRIFTQHYKTFCGFESIESARCYLAVFEKVYRFTPFSQDAHIRIRGKCPLELAGYEVHKLPIAHLFRGLTLHWPAAAFQELVPNV